MDSYGDIAARSFLCPIAPPIIHGLIAGGSRHEDDGEGSGWALGMIEGEPSDKWVRHAIETPGYFLGLPMG